MGEVLEHAAQEQLDVTKSQVDRWVRRGLLPRPTTENLGGRRGKRSVYPAEMVEQVGALTEALTFDRRLDRAGFLIWWWGYEVDRKMVRDYLRTIAASWDQALMELRALAEDQAALEQLIEDSSRARVRNTSIGRVRRRIGRGSFPTVFRILMQVATGSFTGLHVDYATDENEGLLFEKAIGLSRARTDPMPDGMGPWLSSDPEENLSDLSSIMAEPLSDTVNDTPEDELAKASDELRPIIQLLAAMSPALEAKKGPGAYGVTELGRLLGGMSVDDLGQFFVLWLRLRTQPELAHGIAALSHASEDALTHLEREGKPPGRRE